MEEFVINNRGVPLRILAGDWLQWAPPCHQLIITPL
jgi:hypothetical protein